jgi:hypothetical protein
MRVGGKKDGYIGVWQQDNTLTTMYGQEKMEDKDNCRTIRAQKIEKMKATGKGHVTRPN